MKPATTATLQIHFCVLLWGFTAILGKLISLPALPLVWWRMLIVVGILMLVPSVLRSLRALPARLWLGYAGIGCLVALHWLTFYGAIKLANASVAATCIALATPFTALVEPWLTRTRFSARDLLLGIAVLPGVVLVVGGVPAGMREGIVVGAISALFVAVFGSLNKRVALRAPALTATALELGAGVVVLTVLAPLLAVLMPELAGPIFESPTPRDGALLVTLAIACTLLPFSLSFVALRHISAFSAQLAVNLEPVYAIVLAIVLLGEQRELTPQFYLGVAIILAAVLARPLLGRPREVAEPLGT
jgi:drug/metabolite transporter (DMT)-like permease